MNLSKLEIVELNSLLKNTNIDLPDFKRKVGDSGNNYKWLQKNILVRNPNVSDRVKELLHIQ